MPECVGLQNFLILDPYRLPFNDVVVFTLELLDFGLWIFYLDPAQHTVIVVVFQLEFVSVSLVINHMTSYNLSALIGCNYSIQTGEQILLGLFLNKFSTNKST